jgi:hypothetical protein
MPPTCTVQVREHPYPLGSGVLRILPEQLPSSALCYYAAHGGTRRSLSAGLPKGLLPVGNALCVLRNIPPRTSPKHLCLIGTVFPGATR